MQDAIFAEPQLARIYDLWQGDRFDLPHYLAIAAELDARSVLDVGAMLTSDSTRRYPPRAAIEDSLISAGYELTDVRDAPGRPGLELVFIARKPATTS